MPSCLAAGKKKASLRTRTEWQKIDEINTYFEGMKTIFAGTLSL